MINFPGSSISWLLTAKLSFLPEEIIEKLDTVFRIPSEIGYPRNIKGTARDINNPAYITSMGLALYGAEKRLSEVPVITSRLGFFHKAVNRLKALFNDYF